MNIKTYNYNIGQFIEYIHLLLVLYVLFGNLITPTKYLHLYLFLIILIFLDWNDFDGECILTKYEYYFKYGDISNKNRFKREFFRPRFNKLFNLNLSSYDANKLNNFLFMICFLIGYIRLLIYYKIIFY